MRCSNDIPKVRVSSWANNASRSGPAAISRSLRRVSVSMVLIWCLLRSSQRHERSRQSRGRLPVGTALRFCLGQTQGWGEDAHSVVMGLGWLAPPRRRLRDVDANIVWKDEALPGLG